jgi:hypothetical protein
METGIPMLDGFLKGGIPRGRSLLYYIQPGIEGESLGLQTLSHNLMKGKRGVYITSTSSPKVVRESFKEFDWDMDKFGDRFAIVDAYSSLIGTGSNEKYVVEDPHNIKSYDEVMNRVFEDFKKSLVIFGSLSTIIDSCGEETLEFIKKWNKLTTVYDSVSIYSFTAWPYSKELIHEIKESFDAVVEVSGIAERVILGQYYGVTKVDWGGSVGKSVLFRLLRPGGIRAYIPKILVTGPFNAGKSTFIHAISSRAVSVDRLGTTISMDHGCVDHMGFSADIFGTPGQERFDPILKLLGGEAVGVFLVIDSTKPEQFPRAKQMLEKTRAFGLPYVIVANKQDLKGALSEEEIRKSMVIPEDVPIVPTVATKKEGVLKSFEVLIDRITREM